MSDMIGMVSIQLHIYGMLCELGGLHECEPDSGQESQGNNAGHRVAWCRVG